MEIQIFEHFDDAGADSLKIELFLDRDLVVRGWYIGPLIRMAREFMLPFTPREQNLRAETAIARVVEIALAADLPIALIDPRNLWDELWFAHERQGRSPGWIDLPAEGRRRHRRDQLIVRDGRTAGSRRALDRGTHP